MAVHIETGTMQAPKKHTSKVINHLGLVSTMCDKLKIVSTIDQVIKQDQEKRLVSVGQAVKAMIINGLGFAQRALYLTPLFFQDKPVERLIGEGIQAEHLNDDTLGRALDEIYEYGPSELFTQCAIQIANTLNLNPRYGHLDSTSLHVDGEYNSNEEEQDGVIRITKGYSRDHRPDLNQLVLQLICERQSGIPLLMKSISGNKSDKDSFRETIKSHIGQLKTDFGMEYIIADSALYVAETLKEMKDFWWISRVPETINLAHDIIDSVAAELMINTNEQAFCSLGAVYGDVKQHWVVVYSPEAYSRATKSVNKKVLATSESEVKKFEYLCKQGFACEADAQQALIKFEKELQSTLLINTKIVSLPHFNGKGRPAKDRKPDSYSYHIDGCMASQLQYRNSLLQRKSCFILATNQLDNEALTPEAMIAAYKDQQKVERGFRFLKDPLFMASTLFLKSPKRIMALMMVMTLCLAVYAALELSIRKVLRDSNELFPNQKGKLIANPTARWVFQFFTGIHVVVVDCMNEVVLGLNEYHLLLLRLLGEPYQEIYA
jgi:transposase